MSRDENWVLSSEDSSCPEESELELGLGLSLGGSGTVLKTCRGSRARVLSHEGFPSSDVSSSSSPSVADGTKRSADSVASAANGAGQAVGWPPVGAYRMNNLSNQAKPQATEKNKNGVVEKTIDDVHKNDGSAKEKGRRSSSFVKVNMDGSAIGRKVDLKVHGCYETLAKTLEDMFLSPTITRKSKLLDGSSGFALTYEDKDGDWMLVGDVPWRMFLESVNRLRIMRTSEANGLAPLRQRCKPVDSHFTR